MISQSENNIKRSALQFLKMYYRNRPRTGETSTKLNQTTDNGIIADGILFFPKENGEKFLASVEATSFDTRDEVKYKLQRGLIFWDCIMAASALAAFVILFGHFYHIFSFQTNRWMLGVFLGSVFLFGYLVSRYYFSSHSKYRYIYALQQFKQYHADEQWVAIGDNVFYGPEDPMLHELRKQCIKNGFGLLSVDKELMTHLVITPSRDELFASKRKLLNFFGTNSNNENAKPSKVRGWWNSLTSILLKPVTGTSLTRYQRTYYFPMVVSMLMMGLVGFVAYEDLRQKEIVFAEEEKYNQELKEVLLKKEYHEFDQKIDEEVVEPYPKQVPDSYLAVVQPNKREDHIGTKNITPKQEKDKLTPKGGNSNLEIMVKSDGEEVKYNCARFYNFSGKKFIVQDGVYTTQKIAQARLDFLRKKGIEANLMWLKCFTNSEAYTVYIEWLYNDLEEATVMGKVYRKKLKKLNIPENKLSIRTLER